MRSSHCRCLRDGTVRPDQRDYPEPDGRDGATRPHLRLGRVRSRAGSGSPDPEACGRIVEEQHHRVSRRVHGGPDNVIDWRGEVRVGGAREAARTMRVQLRPSQTRRTERNEIPTASATLRPVPSRDLCGRSRAGQRQHFGEGSAGPRWLAGRAGSRRASGRGRRSRRSREPFGPVRVVRRAGAGAAGRRVTGRARRRAWRGTLSSTTPVFDP